MNGAPQPRRRHRGDELNVLIVALDTAVPVELPLADVLVVAPALNSWLRRWVSDEDAARRRAKERAAVFVEQLEQLGIRAEGRVGDADPLLAIADALWTFPADEIVISAGPERPSRFVDQLVTRVRDRFALPVFRARPRAITSYPNTAAA